jgi:ribosomal protein L33
MALFTQVQQMIDKDAELEKSRERRRRYLRMLDRKLKQEEVEIKARGFCPVCRLNMTTTGKCPVGH